jgi:hypothetical protein
MSAPVTRANTWCQLVGSVLMYWSKIYSGPRAIESYYTDCRLTRSSACAEASFDKGERETNS